MGSKVLFVSAYIGNEITGEKERASIQVKMESAKALGTTCVVGYLSRYISRNSSQALNHVVRRAVVLEPASHVFAVKHDKFVTIL